MSNKIKYKKELRTTVTLGAVMVVLLISLGVSFFVLIRNSQLSSRKDFLTKQTEIAARQLELEMNRFEEDAKIIMDFMEDDDMDPEDFRDEFTKTVRRIFVGYPGLVEFAQVDFGDSTIIFSMTERNDFIRKPYSDALNFINEQNNLYKVLGSQDLGLLFSLNLSDFTQDFVSNYYLNPNGSKYLIINGELNTIEFDDNLQGITFDSIQVSIIKEDVELGVKGIYNVGWAKEGDNGEGFLAQYPFDFGEIEKNASLLFFVESDDFSSGFYTTYIFLFAGFVLLLAVAIGIFTTSLRNILKSRRLFESKTNEISELFDQQNLLLKELQGFVFFHDNKGNITRVSEEVEDIIGQPMEVFLLAFSKGSKQEDMRRIRKKFLAGIEKKLSSLDFEYDYVKRNGQRIRLRVFEKLFFDNNGDFQGGSGICTDITKQFEARSQLIISENKLRTVIENIPDIISIYDHTGKILNLNLKDNYVFLNNSESYIGRNLKDLMPEDQKDHIFKVFNLARISGNIQTTELNVVLVDQERVFEVRFFPLDNSQIMSISKEITSQKIWEKGLIEAMEAADRANQAKSEFLANMSHEIRTPMNGLLGIIDLLEQTELNEVQKEYVDIVKNSGNSLLSIIKDILDYSKIEAGKIDVNSFFFKPGKELESKVNFFYGLARKKEIKLTTEISDDAYLWYEGDMEKISQILINLIGNAIKFTPKGGGIFIKMDINNPFDSVYFLNCEVHDTGIGIPEEKIPSLTDPFFQLESSTSRSFQGTGLGLTIAKKMIEMMGGELNIESELGKGATFSFSVMLTKAENQELLDQNTENEQRENWKNFGSEFPSKILLAEDNDLNLQLMKLILTEMGYHFEVAKNGQEALEWLKKEAFDVILMDVQMPVLNGLETTKKIREGEIQKDIYIVGLSANVFDEDLKKAQEFGMDDYLTKPIRLSALVNKLEQVYVKIKVLAPKN